MGIKPPLHPSSNKQWMFKLKSIRISIREVAAMNDNATLLSMRMHWAKLAYSRNACYLILLHFTAGSKGCLKKVLVAFVKISLHHHTN